MQSLPSNFEELTFIDNHHAYASPLRTSDDVLPDLEEAMSNTKLDAIKYAQTWSPSDGDDDAKYSLYSHDGCFLWDASYVCYFIQDYPFEAFGIAQKYSRKL